MNLTKTKKNMPLIMISLIGVLAVIVVVGIVVQVFMSKTNTQTSPGISSDPTTGYNQTFDKNAEKDQASPDPLQKVADLRSKLPYQGTYFSLDFDYDNQTFLLTINKGNEAAGNTEFEKFLQDNEVNKKDMKISITVK